MAEYAIETIDLGRRFGRIEALTDVSLTVPTGELVGLIGPNGAGKTTFIMLLLGILRPSRGRLASPELSSKLIRCLKSKLSLKEVSGT